MTSREATILAGAGLMLVVLSFVLGLAVCSRARRWGPAFGFDFPGGSLGHRVPVSLAGGVAVWVSMLSVFGLAVLACTVGRPVLPEAVARYVDGLWYRSGELAVILGLSTAILVVGLLTDLFEFGWKLQLGSQVLAAAALAGLGTRVTLFWPFNHPIIGTLVTILWVVGLINAFAFLDNMDGLAAGIGLIASTLFAATQLQGGGLFAPAVLLVVAGVLGGFLVFNRYPAQLFLGRGGSWVLGFLLGALTIAGTYYRYDSGDSPNSILSPLLVMAVPFYESAVVLLIWFSEREQGFVRNPRHYSYRLQEIGLSPAQSVRILLLVSLGAGLGSLMLRRLDAVGTVVLAGQTACLIGVVGVMEFGAIRRKRSRETVDRKQS